MTGAVLGGLGWLVVLAAVTVVVIGWLVASRVLRPKRRPPTTIFQVTEDSVRLERTALSAFPGPMGLLYADETQHARLGEVTGVEAGTVTREMHLHDVPVSAPSVGRVTSDPFGTPGEARLTLEEEVLLGQDGRRAPAWVVRGAVSTQRDWAIHVHGALAGREAMLRTAKTFADQSFTSLLITYRGDQGVMRAGRASTLGQLEWEDLEPAVDYARRNGAERIVLVGMSLGATVALAFAARSSDSKDVDGLVLIAPMLDWKTSVEANVRAARLPGVIATAAVWLMSHRPWSTLLGLPESLRFEELDFTRSGAVRHPTLIIHTQGDPVAPFAATRRLAKAASELVSIVPVPGDDHALEWNRDPTRFAEAIQTWLGRISPQER